MAGIPGVLRLTLESADGKFRQSGSLDGGHPHGEKVRQASFLLPREMDCYSCHQQHGAVDTTFVQFYPTLLEIAKKKNTLSAAYAKEEAGK